MRAPTRAGLWRTRRIPLRGLWGTNHVDGTGGTLGVDCDVGRGGVASPGGTNWIGISGSQEVEGRKFFAMVGGSIGLV